MAQFELNRTKDKSNIDTQPIKDGSAYLAVDEQSQSGDLYIDYGEKRYNVSGNIGYKKITTKGFKIIGWNGEHGKAGYYIIDYATEAGQEIPLLKGKKITLMNDMNVDSYCTIIQAIGKTFTEISDTGIELPEKQVTYFYVDKLYTNSQFENYNKANYNIAQKEDYKDKLNVNAFGSFWNNYPDLGWMIKARENGSINYSQQACLFINDYPELGTFDWFKDSYTLEKDNLAQGKVSFAQGEGNKAYGKYSTVFGKNNKAGYADAVFGRNNDASGAQVSFVAGQENIIGGLGFCHAVFGEGNKITGGSHKLVAGKFNKEKNINILELGYGSGNLSRKNIFEVDKDGKIYSNEMENMLDQEMIYEIDTTNTPIGNLVTNFQEDMFYQIESTTSFIPAEWDSTNKCFKFNYTPGKYAGYFGIKFNKLKDYNHKNYLMITKIEISNVNIDEADNVIQFQSYRRNKAGQELFNKPYTLNHWVSADSENTYPAIEYLFQYFTYDEDIDVYGFGIDKNGSTLSATIKYLDTQVYALQELEKKNYINFIPQFIDTIQYQPIEYPIVENNVEKIAVGRYSLNTITAPEKYWLINRLYSTIFAPGNKGQFFIPKTQETKYTLIKAYKNSNYSNFQQQKYYSILQMKEKEFHITKVITLWAMTTNYKNKSLSLEKYWNDITVRSYCNELYIKYDTLALFGTTINDKHLSYIANLGKTSYNEDKTIYTISCPGLSGEQDVMISFNPEEGIHLDDYKKQKEVYDLIISNSYAKTIDNAVEIHILDPNIIDKSNTTECSILIKVV